MEIKAIGHLVFFYQPWDELLSVLGFLQHFAGCFAHASAKHDGIGVQS